MSWLEVDIKKALPGFTLNVKWNMGKELTVLFGYSGAGKTMTLQILAGLQNPDEGLIVCEGEPLVTMNGRIRTSLTPQKRGIGYVFQDLALFPHMSVRKNIEYALVGRSSAERAGACNDIMDTMEIGQLERKYPSQISGGQKQRVALARALVNRPRLLILDEPFSALDAPLRHRMRSLLLDVRRKFGTPVVMVTHDLYEARAIADRIVMYSGGRVVGQGAPVYVLHGGASASIKSIITPPSF